MYIYHTSIIVCLKICICVKTNIAFVLQLENIICFRKMCFVLLLNYIFAFIPYVTDVAFVYNNKTSYIFLESILYISCQYYIFLYLSQSNRLNNTNSVSRYFV